MYKFGHIYFDAWKLVILYSYGPTSMLYILGKTQIEINGQLLRYDKEKSG